MSAKTLAAWNNNISVTGQLPVLNTDDATAKKVG
jgi:hypothetical protein